MSIETIGGELPEMPSSLNDACRKLDLAYAENERLRATLSVARDYLSDIGDHPEPGDMIKMIDATLGNQQSPSESK